MKEGIYFISLDTVVERMATLMNTRRNNGTYDDFFYYGMQEYNISHGNELSIDNYLKPNYETIRILFEEQESVVILALSGEPGLYLALAGVTGLGNP
jgi:hypothetical protein